MGRVKGYIGLGCIRWSPEDPDPAGLDGYGQADWIGGYDPVAVNDSSPPICP